MPHNRPYKDEQDFPFEELLENSSIFFYHCDISKNFSIRFISANVQLVLGFKKERFLNDEKFWLNRIHPDDREHTIARYKKAKGQEKTVVEFRFKHKDGRYLWRRDELRCITDDQGNPESLVGTSFDITDQKKTEAELKKLNQTLEERIKERTSRLVKANRKLQEQHQTLKLQEMALRSLNDMVIITRAPRDKPLDGRIIFVNKAFEQFTGYKRSEVLDRSPELLHGPETSRESVRKINNHIRAHRPVREELVNYKKDGTPYWVELDMTPFPAPEDEFEFWIGINRDVTQRKEAEQRLEESEQLYRAFAELSFDAIFEIDQNGIIINCNRRAEELFGYSLSELLGMNILNLKPAEEHKNWEAIAEEVRNKNINTYDRIYLKKDGSRFPAEVHAQGYQTNGRDHFVVYIRDYTEHKEYEDKIKSSLKEKETLLAEIHHRVKNNLAIISGLLDMQAFNTTDDLLLEKLHESQSRIQSIAMVHEKLYSSESFSEIAFDRYIDELQSMICSSYSAPDKEIRVTKDMERVLLTINRAIPCGLLVNELLTNCYKHAFSGRQSGTICIFLKKKEQDIMLSVKDDGVGLPEDFKIDNESSLGMTLVHTLIEQLNGNLDVSSEAGSSFTMIFQAEE